MKMKYKNIEQLIKSKQWVNSDPAFGSTNNYIGDDRSEWINVIGRNRDSDLLTESNFQAALDMLGGEQEGLIEVAHFSHWACGWYELIQVNKTNKKGLKIALDILNKIDAYPVLDESDFSDREHKERIETCEQEQKHLAESLAELIDIKPTKKLQAICFDVIYESMSYSGNESYPWIRKNPDIRELKELKNDFGRVIFLHKKSSVLHSVINKLSAKIGAAS